MLGNQIDYYINNSSQPQRGAILVIMLSRLVACCVVVVFAQHIASRQGTSAMTSVSTRRVKALPILIWGYIAWSLVPVLIAVIYSFNDGRSRTMWKGFSFRWWFGDPNTHRCFAMNPCVKQL
jgi:ABC-type Fe3+ transport system permease subunit